MGRRSRLRLHALALGLLAGLGFGAPAVASAQVTEGPPVDSLVVEGNRRVSADQIIQSSGIVLFQPANYRTIQRAIQALFSTGKFDDVQVEQRRRRREAHHRHHREGAAHPAALGACAEPSR